MQNKIKNLEKNKNSTQKNKHNKNERKITTKEVLKTKVHTGKAH